MGMAHDKGRPQPSFKLVPQTSYLGLEGTPSPEPQSVTLCGAGGLTDAAD